MTSNNNYKCTNEFEDIIHRIESSTQPRYLKDNNQIRYSYTIHSIKDDSNIINFNMKFEVYSKFGTLNSIKSYINKLRNTKCTWTEYNK